MGRLGVERGGGELWSWEGGEGEGGGGGGKEVGKASIKYIVHLIYINYRTSGITELEYNYNTWFAHI